MSCELISVVMTIYNEPINIIKEAVESIMSQTYDFIEIIVVVDNPNNKEGINYLKKNEKVILIVNPYNYGLPKSLNIGISKAHGNIIARMDSDDISHPNRMREQYHFLKNNNFDFVTSNVQFINENGELIDTTYALPKNIEEMMIRLRFENCLIHPTFMFYKYVFDKNKGYKEELLAAQDYEFILNSISNNFKIGLQDLKLLKYRVREKSISNKRFIMQIYIKFYIQDLYFKNKTYDANFLTQSLKENTNDYILFKKEFITYKESNSQNKFIIFVHKVYCNLRYIHIRRNTINLICLKLFKKIKLYQSNYISNLCIKLFKINPYIKIIKK